MTQFLPLVSIIVPVYNAARFLRECINSICNCGYENIEIILVDDGSSDDSLKIMKEFAKYDDRIFIVQKQNSGQSSARNVGLAFIKNSIFRNFVNESAQNDIKNQKINLPKVDFINSDLYKYDPHTHTHTQLRCA